MKKLLTVLLTITIILGSCPSAAAIGLLFPVIGDADSNGRITSADARLILRAAVGLHTPLPLRKALYDVDSDGKISASDARAVLRYAVGLDRKEEISSVKAATEKVSQKELSALMNEICDLGSRSIIYTKNNLKAQDYIAGKLREYGVNFKKQGFTYAGIETANIISTLQKGTESSEILLICTHFDSPDNTAGAIDNASGMAALLHVIRLIKENNISLRGEIRIAFFSAEEMGYYGAQRYISSLSDSEKSRMKVFNIDMAGYSSLGGGKILTVSTEPVTGAYPHRPASENSLSKAIDSAKELLGSLGEEKYLSPVSAGKHDIVPFRLEKIEAVTLSWREIRKDGAAGSDYDLSPPSQIHTSLDTVENFNMKSLYNTTRLILAALLTGFSE